MDLLVIRLWTFGSVMDFLLERYCIRMQLVLWTFRSWMDFLAFQKQSGFNSNSVITCWTNWCYELLQIHWTFGLFGNQFDFISLGVMKLFNTFSTWYKTSNLLSSVQIAFRQSRNISVCSISKWVLEFLETNSICFNLVTDIVVFGQKKFQN